MRAFFDARAPAVKLDLISLDLQPTWHRYVEENQMRFIQWDLNDGGLLAKCGCTIDYVIISYVLIYCTNDKTADMLTRLLTQDHVKAVLISERYATVGHSGPEPYM